MEAEQKKIPNVIFFDFGKTLHGFDLDIFFNWLAQYCGIERHHLWDIFSRFPDGLLYNYECGEGTSEFIDQVREALVTTGLTLKCEQGFCMRPPLFTNEEFLTHWNNIFDTGPVAEDRMRLLRGLKQNGCRLFVLSNINEAQYRCVKNDPRFAEIFQLTERFIASCDADIACRKTRFHTSASAVGVLGVVHRHDNWSECIKIFTKALEIAGVENSGDAVYVDDILDYVEVFRKMGGHGIHHTGPWTKVESELFSLGLRWQ